MNGLAWAAVAGVLFGVFQAVNRASLVEMDVDASTFIQLLVCSAFMVGALLIGGTGDLRQLSALALMNFAIAGLIHFLIGWTLLNVSQKRLGAARTSPLIATTPLFGTAVAAITLHEIPGIVEIVAMILIVVGVYVAQLERAVAVRVRSPVVASGHPAAERAARSGSAGESPPPMWWSVFGLGAALSWAVSPVFIRNGLDVVDDPVLGVAIGVVAATVAYGLVLLARRRTASLISVSGSALGWKVVAGILVALATWTRWYSLSLASVAAVLSLALLSVPTVLFLAPIVAGRQLERITRSVVVGSALVVSGSLVLIGRG